MRTQIVLIFGLICLLIVSLGMYASADVVGYWAFDEGSGDVAKDISGNGNDGELVNGPQWVEGKDQMALQFSSDDNSYVQVPNTGVIENFGSDDFTAMAWYKIEEAEMDASKIILCTGSFGWNKAGFYICLRPGGQITFEMTDTHGNGGTAIDFDGLITYDGEWHHIAGVYELAKKGYLYVDGELRGEADMSSWKDGIASDRGFRVAEYFWQEGGRLNFDGLIDEVVLFDTALSEEEIGAAMNMEELFGYKAINPIDKLTATWGSIKVGR